MSARMTCTFLLAIPAVSAFASARSPIFQVHHAIRSAAPIAPSGSTVLPPRLQQHRSRARSGVFVASASDSPAEDDDRLPRSLLPISLAVFVQMLGEGIAISTVPLHMRSLGASPIEVGAATSAFSLAQLVCCPLLVKTSGRIGRTTILRTCLAGASISALVITLSSSIYGVIFGRLMAGVFAASIPVAQAGVTDVVRPSQSALALSRVSAVSQLGVVIGPAFSALGAAALGALGVPSHLRVRGVFATSGLFALGVLGLTRGAASAAASATDAPSRGGAESKPAAAAPPPAPSAEAAAAAARLPGASAVHSGAFAQVLLRAIALAVGWSLTLCVSTYCLFGSAFLGYAQPQLSATFSAGAALTVLTQLAIVPRVVKRLGEHSACALGMGALWSSLAGFSLVKGQPFHVGLYLTARLGAGVADTSTATLVARSSDGSDERARNLALIQSTRAGARIITPILSGWLFERSRHAAFAPGALPYLVVASLLVALTPVPLVLKRFEAEQQQRQQQIQDAADSAPAEAARASGSRA